MKTRFLTTQVLLFLFAASWLNVPGMLYERFSIHKFLAYHGHDLFPFFLPVFLVFLVFTVEMSRFCKVNTFIKFSGWKAGQLAQGERRVQQTQSSQKEVI